MALASLLSACAGSIFAGTDQEAAPINDYYGSQTTGGMPLAGPPTGAAGGNSGH